MASYNPSQNPCLNLRSTRSKSKMFGAEKEFNKPFLRSEAAEKPNCLVRFLRRLLFF